MDHGLLISAAITVVCLALILLTLGLARMGSRDFPAPPKRDTTDQQRRDDRNGRAAA